MQLKNVSVAWFSQSDVMWFFSVALDIHAGQGLSWLFARLSVGTKQRNASHPSHTRFEIHRIAVLGPWIVLSGWLLGVAAAAVDAWWEQPQRQNSFFVGPDSSGIGQLLSDPVEQITCRVETIQCGQCAWQRRVVSVRCWVLAVIITPPSSVKLANFGFYFALHCTRHLHVLLITGDCRSAGCRIL